MLAKSEAEKNLVHAFFMRDPQEFIRLINDPATTAKCVNNCLDAIIDVNFDWGIVDMDEAKKMLIGDPRIDREKLNTYFSQAVRANLSEKVDLLQSSCSYPLKLNLSDYQKIESFLRAAGNFDPVIVKLLLKDPIINENYSDLAVKKILDATPLATNAHENRARLLLLFRENPHISDQTRELIKFNLSDLPTETIVPIVTKDLLDKFSVLLPFFKEEKSNEPESTYSEGAKP